MDLTFRIVSQAKEKKLQECARYSLLVLADCHQVIE